MNKASAVGFKGELVTKVIRAPKANLGWRLKNYSRWSFIIGWIQYWLAKLLSRTFGILTITSELKAVLVKADGSRVNYGILSHKLVTDAGVAFLVDDWDGGANDFSLFNYHGCGTGSVAENVADTALGTESTTILNPDSTRATGTKSQPTASQMRTVGTATFDGAGAITEHGIFTQAATGGGTLWDRSVFTAINVASGDSIQFTYTCTINSGG